MLLKKFCKTSVFQRTIHFRDKARDLNNTLPYTKKAILCNQIQLEYGKSPHPINKAFKQ